MNSSLREEALSKIRTLILSDKLSAGALFSEREIAERLSISRTPVREALAVLASLALIDQYPQKGIRVRTIDVQEALEVLRIHAGIQSAVVQELVQLRRPDALDHLRNLVREMKQATDPKAFLITETLFHCEIARLANCSSAVAVVRGLRDRLHLFRIQHPRLLLADVSAIAEEHLKIVEASAESAASAEAAVKQHFSNAEKRLIKSLEQYSAHT